MPGRHSSDDSDRRQPLLKSLEHGIEQDKAANGQNASRVPRGVIDPNTRWAARWWAFTIFSAVVSGGFVPYAVGFAEDPGELPFMKPAVMADQLLQLTFFIDMLLSFRLAFYEDDLLITNPHQITWHYLRGRFWVDLAGWFPLDFLAYQLLQPRTQVQANYISLLRLIHLSRCYRIAWWFQHLEWRLTVSLLVTTLMRNLLYVFYVTHMAACGFYFIALQHGLGTDTWIGAHFGDVSSVPVFERYCFALYWAITTLSTTGFGDISSQNIAEALWATAYMYTSLAVSAYILGSITLLVVKGDEQAGTFRDQANAMKKYSRVHGIPEALCESMQAHLRVHHANDAASDEAVLYNLPTPLRRRVLRFMYLEQLTSTAIFKNARQRFLDALLGAARLELFLPQMEIVAASEFVNELMVLVSGHCTALSPGSLGSGEHLVLGDELGLNSCRRQLGPGHALGAVAFFTEVPQLSAVRTDTTCRVLIMSRDAYRQVAGNFPLSARAVLDNLLLDCEQMVRNEFPGEQGAAQFARVANQHRPDLQYGWASPEMAEDQMRRATEPDLPRPDDGRQEGQPEHQQRRDGYAGPFRELQRTESLAELHHRQEQAVASLMRTRDIVRQCAARQDSERVNAIMYAASHGDTATVRQILHQGQDPDAKDYDGRTALMVACAKGHRQVVKVLLGAGADATNQDSMGSCALLEAIKQGHDDIMELLLEKHSLLAIGDLELAGRMCTAVFEGDVTMLKRLLHAGAPPGTADYDARTSLHIAAAEGNIAAAKVLVKAGGKQLVQQADRWGRTAQDEAERLGHQPLVQLMQDAAEVQQQ